MTKARDISRYGLGVGIQSAGSVVTGVGITQLNFIGAGNTFRVSDGTVDISISGGGIGIQSSNAQIGAGITQLNFIGAGNTFRVSDGTVDISISGGGGAGVSTSGITTSAIFSNFGTIWENQDLGKTGHNYFAAGPVAITATVTVGAGNTFVII